jgi:hypothetical protein
MRQSHLQIRQEGKLSAGPSDLLEVEHRGNDRFLKDWTLNQNIASGTRENGSSREGFAALESNQLGECDIYAVFAGDILGQPGPTRQAHRPARGVIAGDHSPSGAGARNDDQLSSIQGREHRGEGVPRVLTDQHGGAAPPGIECLNAAARFDEPLLVEDTVGGQKDFPVNVADAGIGSAECGIEAGIVEPVPMHFIEAECDVEGGNAGLRMLSAQIIEQLIRRYREIAYTALEEVPGERGFGRNDQFRRLGPTSNFSKEGADPAEILLVRTLVGPYLGYG